MGNEKGTSGINGSHSGASSSSSVTKSTCSPPPALKDSPVSPPPATRAGVKEAFAKHGHFMNVTRGPHPSQHGDGTMTLFRSRPGLKQDLKKLKTKGEGGFHFCSTGGEKMC